MCLHCVSLFLLKFQRDVLSYDKHKILNGLSDATENYKHDTERPAYAFNHE